MAGEYAVLKSGAALIAATSPSFEIHFARGRGEFSHFHQDSPAGRFIRERAAFFAKFDISFLDPTGLGGLGASTAQFLAVYFFHEQREACLFETERELDHHHLLKTYLECAWQGEGFAPSGADLIGQERGYLSLVDKSAGQFKSFSWNLTHLGFHLIHTGMKLATHEHLKVTMDFSVEEMKKSFSLIEAAIHPVGDILQREDSFILGINQYAQALGRQGLTAPHSIDLLTEISNLSGVRAAKACGAMGSDVLFVVVEKNSREVLQHYIQAKKLRELGTEDSLSAGLQVQVLKGDLF